MCGRMLPNRKRQMHLAKESGALLPIENPYSWACWKKPPPLLPSAVLQRAWGDPSPACDEGAGRQHPGRWASASSLGACSAPFNVLASLGVSTLGGHPGVGKHSLRVVTVTAARGGGTEQDSPGTTHSEGTGDGSWLLPSLIAPPVNKFSGI